MLCTAGADKSNSTPPLLAAPYHTLLSQWAPRPVLPQRQLRLLLGDLTFQEAFERTGRVLNVVVCAADTNEPPRVLNYLTAPDAVIWSAVAASSAFPGLFQPTDMIARNAKGEYVRYGGKGAAAKLHRSCLEPKVNPLRVPLLALVIPLVTEGACCPA